MIVLNVLLEEHLSWSEKKNDYQIRILQIQQKEMCDLFSLV